MFLLFLLLVLTVSVAADAVSISALRLECIKALYQNSSARVYFAYGIDQHVSRCGFCAGVQVSVPV